MKEPQVAKRDIVVLKYLTTDGDNYKTPCQNTRVNLNEMLDAKGAVNLKHYDNDRFGNEVLALNGGMVNAKLSENGDYGNCCKLAVIPKGTKYRVDPFGLEIAAERMLITDKDGSNEAMGTAFWEEILENAPEVNGIRVGDYMLESGKFVHPSKKMKGKVRGIVAGFHEDKPLIVALEVFQEPFDTQYSSKIGEHTGETSDTIKLFNGQEITKKYKDEYAGKDDNAKRFKAFEVCINYRKDKNEEWYYGAFGEVTTMLNNAIFLNAAWHITGLGFELNTSGWYSSCSEESSHGSWSCYLNGGRVYCYWYYKGYSYRVVPFFASQTKSKSKTKKKTKVK